MVAVASEAETEETEVDANFLEIGGYIPKESIYDVTTGANLEDDQRDQSMDLEPRVWNKQGVH